MKFINSGNGALKAINKKYENSEIITAFVKVNCDLKTKISPMDSCLNIIRVSEDVKKSIGEEKYFVLVNLSNGNFINVVADEQALTGEENAVRITNFAAKTIKAEDTSELLLCCQKYFEFTRVKSQKLENVKSDTIVVPEGCVPGNLLSDFSLIEILNPLTNDSVFVQSKHITVESELLPGEIRINKKQRTMLSDNIPVRLSATQYDKLVLHAENQEETKEILEQNYKSDGKAYVLQHNIEQISYSMRISLQKIVKREFGERLILRPVLESYKKPVRKNTVKLVCDFFVGKSTLSLNCRRPHECDENSDIVRMTEDNMLFLGIEAMDKVIIQYKHKSISCHVMPFDFEKLKVTNVPCVEEFTIGIPAHIRDKLGIVDIQSAVKVDRDTGFIFRKSFNEQLVPVFLAIMSLNFFENTKWYITLLLVAMMIPLVMYITLSTKRNMRGR